jgi:hypothetical protein
MIFGAGLGVGLMVFATAEPLGLKAYSPEILDGAVMPLRHYLGHQIWCTRKYCRFDCRYRFYWCTAYRR